MRLLLDSCTFLWLRTGDSRVSSAAILAVEDPANEAYFSAISALEIALKYTLGKLPLPDDPRTYLANAIAESTVRVLPISLSQGVAAGCLPLHHRDPFDRILVAQCQEEGLTIVSPDPAFRRYGVSVLW